MVASTSLGDHLDLERIASRLDGAEYEPAEFPGLIYRMKDPKTAVLLFKSGKVVCTGGKSSKQVDESIRAISALIRKGGQTVLAHPKIEIQNIVATSSLETEINLTSIALALGLDRVEYEPEQFPGLVCRLESPRVVVLLFGSGKLVCTGAKRPKDAELAVEHIAKELARAGLLDGKRTPAPARTPGSSHRTPSAPRAPTALEADPSPTNEETPAVETFAE